jgi:hypothetical protein
MTDIGTLVIRLEAQTASLRADMAEARRVIDQHASASTKAFAGMQAAARGVAVAVGSIGLSVGVGAMVSFAKQVIETTGGLGELADQLGVTTDGLQALQFQALQSGASAETLEAGIARLTRSIGDAGEGNDALIARFRELGVGILDATGKLRPTEDVLGAVAKGIAGIEDPAKQAAAVVDLFGKSGQKLLPVLRDIAEIGIEGVKRKAREAGAVVNEDVIKRFDKLADDLAVKMKIAVVAVADALGDVVGQAQRAGTAVAEFFRRADRSPEEALARRFPTQLANPEALRRAMASRGASFDIGRFNELPPAAQGPLPPIAAEAPRLPRSSRELNNELGAEKLIESLRLQRDSYGLLESAILRMRLERERDQQVVNGAIVDLGPKFTKTQIDAAVGVQKQVEALARLREELGQWFADAKEQEAALMRQGDAWRDLAARRSEFDRSTERNLANAARETELIAQSAVVWNRYTQQFERANRVVEIHREEQRILAENLALTDDAARELAERIVAANEAQREAIQKVDAEVKRQQQSYEFLSGMGERAFDRIGDAATAMALEGQDAFSSLRNVARAVIASIYSDFMKLAIANPIKNAIFGGNAPTLGGGGLNGVFAGLFGGGGGQAAGNSVATVGNPGAGFTGGTFARGGRPPMRRASWVGEEGPEIFVPDVAGRIYPHDESMAMAGGGGDTYMIDARGADERGLMRLEALIRQLNGSIEKRAVLAVGSAMNRGSFP